MRWEVWVVVFPKDGMAMAMIECDGELVDQTGINLAEVSARVAHSLAVKDTWGTWMWGRVLAPVSNQALLDRSVSAVVRTLGSC